MFNDDFLLYINEMQQTEEFALEVAQYESEYWADKENELKRKQKEV